MIRKITLLSFLLSAYLHAQTPGFGVTISTQNGGELKACNPAPVTPTVACPLAPGTEEYRVAGFVQLPAGANQSDYLLLVQGQSTPFIAAAAPNTYTFVKIIPVGPTIIPAGGWSNWAYSNYYTDHDRITKPLIAEVVQKTTNEVMARFRSVLIDKRFDPALQADFTGTRVTESMGIEITAQGLDKLEALHKSNMPQPSLSSFNTSLTNAFRGFNSTLVPAPNTNLGNVISPGNLTPKACMPVSSAPNALQSTTAYATFLAEVTYEYAAYQAAKQMLDTGSIASAITAAFPGLNLLVFASQAALAAKVATSCVDKLPLPSHFEVCGGTLRGDAATLTIDGIRSSNLELGTRLNSSPPNIMANNTLDRLYGEVDGKWSNFFFRYAEKPVSGCLGRPRTALQEAQIQPGSEIDNWRRCPRMGFTSRTPSNIVPIEFNINADSSPNLSLEKNQVDTSLAATPLFQLGTNQDKDPQEGLCSNDGFNHNADALLDRFWERTRSSVDTVWKANTPNTQQAKSLDLVFSRLETGLYGDTNLTGSSTGRDHELIQNYNVSRSRNLTDRIVMRTDTEAKSLVSPSPLSWILTPSEIYPCNTVSFVCNPNQSAFNQNFDFSFSVTTMALNQVLKELSTSPLLTFNYEPTYNDLGISPAPGALGTDKAILDGTNLARLDPAFAALGGNVASIVVTPTIVPFTYVNPQPAPGTQQGRTNLTYHLAQLRFELVVPKPAAVGVDVWLGGVSDFYDRQLILVPDAPASLNRLKPAYGSSAGVGFTLLQNRFSSCAFGPILPPIQPPLPAPQIPYPTCANALAGKLHQPFSNLLRQRLLYMLSRFPAPLFFDAGGVGGALSFSYIDRYQRTNLITYYGNLQ